MPKTPIIVLTIIVLAAAGVGFSLRKQSDTSKTASGATSSTQNSSASGATQSTEGSSSTSSTNATSYSKSDVAKHSSVDDCWTITNGGVYNLTSFIPSHPGGEQIVQACGVDASSMFDAQHGYSRQAQSELSRLKIGALAS